MTIGDSQNLIDLRHWEWFFEKMADIAMVTSAADLGDLQTKPNNAYLPLHDIPFWISHTKDNAMESPMVIIYPK